MVIKEKAEKLKYYLCHQGPYIYFYNGIGEVNKKIVEKMNILSSKFSKLSVIEISWESQKKYKQSTSLCEMNTVFLYNCSKLISKAYIPNEDKIIEIFQKAINFYNIHIENKANGIDKNTRNKFDRSDINSQEDKIKKEKRSQRLTEYKKLHLVRQKIILPKNPNYFKNIFVNHDLMIMKKTRLRNNKYNKVMPTERILKNVTKLENFDKERIITDKNLNKSNNDVVCKLIGKNHERNNISKLQNFCVFGSPKKNISSSTAFIEYIKKNETKAVQNNFIDFSIKSLINESKNDSVLPLKICDTTQKSIDSNFSVKTTNYSKNIQLCTNENVTKTIDNQKLNNSYPTLKKSSNLARPLKQKDTNILRNNIPCKRGKFENKSELKKKNKCNDMASTFSIDKTFHY